MINRINLILRAKNITARQFAEEIGIQPSGMSHILGGRNNPSLDFVTKVLRRYPEIDANWLLLGKGEMYTSGQQPSVPTEMLQRSVSDSFSQLPQEPSLFEEDSSHLMEAEEQNHKPYYQQDVFLAEESNYVPGSNTSARNQELDRVRKLDCILFIYSDNTYKELHPQG